MTDFNVDRRTFLKRAGLAAPVRPWPAGSRCPARRPPRTPPCVPIPPPSAAARCATAFQAPAHFDVHQSGTVANIGPRARCTTRCIRRSPKDGQTIIPDLRAKWDISPDGKKYTFHLRKGVKFHDGADFTAEDVKATYDRIARPPKGVVIPRTPLFATVGEIVVVDPHTIEFRHDRAAPQA
jgi:ABC-type transport system substrate-binding protein